jgi:hypothetical protein
MQMDGCDRVLGAEERGLGGVGVEVVRAVDE